MNLRLIPFTGFWFPVSGLLSLVSLKTETDCDRVKFFENAIWLGVFGLWSLVSGLRRSLASLFMPPCFRVGFCP